MVMQAFPRVRRHTRGEARRAAWPAAIAVGLLAILVSWTLREAVTAGDDRLPGTDAGIHYAWEVYTRSAFGSGYFPYWNPYLYAGMPHAADSQMMVFYPPAVLLRWLPPERFLTYLAALHLVIGGAGTLLLARLLGLGWTAAATAAVAVAVGGSTGPWLQKGHLLIVNCVAWLPWALAAAIASVRRTSLLPHPALPVLLAVQFLAGYLQGALYITAVVAFYFLYSAAWPDPRADGGARWRALVQLAVVGVLTLGLSAFQFFPLATLAAEAGRTAGMSYEDSVRGGWTLRDLATFFAPNPGAPDRTAYVGWLLACLVPLSFFDRPRRRAVVFFSVLTAAAVALAFGDGLPFFRLHHYLFPGLRIPGRALFVATLSLAVLGAIGLAWLVGQAAARRLRVAPLAAVGALLAMAAVVTLVPGAPFAAAMQGRSWVAWLTLAGLLAMIAAGRQSRTGVACSIGVFVLAADLSSFAAGAVETVPRDPPEAIARWLGPPDGGRVVSFCENKVSRMSLLTAARPAIEGPLGMYLREYTEWLNLAYAGERPSDAIGRFSVRRDLLDSANVSTFVACEPLDAPSLRLIANADSVFVYRNAAAWPRAVWTCQGDAVPREQVTARLREARYEDVGQLVQRVVINVRWAPGLDVAARRRLEDGYGLVEGVHREETTWRYVLKISSPENVLALVKDPAVQDTHGVDRQTGTRAPSDGDAKAAGSDMVIGFTTCAGTGHADLVAADRPDGRVVADVEATTPGVVFLSEPYYPERVAFVDGRPVSAVKANLAFTAVPVPAGRHRVELQFVPRSFHAGIVATAFTAIAWAVAAAWPSIFLKNRQP